MNEAKREPVVLWHVYNDGDHFVPPYMTTLPDGAPMPESFDEWKALPAAEWDAALAAAYARGREDATKENVGLLQRVDDLVRRVAAVESYRASSTAAAPHDAAKAWLLP